MKKTATNWKTVLTEHTIKKELVSKIHKFYITVREAQTPNRKNGQGIFHRRGNT